MCRSPFLNTVLILMQCHTLMTDKQVLCQDRMTVGEVAVLQMQMDGDAVESGFKAQCEWCRLSASWQRLTAPNSWLIQKCWADRWSASGAEMRD